MPVLTEAPARVEARYGGVAQDASLKAIHGGGWRTEAGPVQEKVRACGARRWRPCERPERSGLGGLRLARAISGVEGRRRAP